MPNFGDWHPGDIVLVHAQASPVGKLLRAGQRLSRNELMRAGSDCTHAGIYVGNGVMVDANRRSGVSACSVWDFCQFRSLQLRRVKDAAIPAERVAEIASKAATHIGEPYSVVEVLLAKLGWSDAQRPDPQALYCSTFVGLVVTEATDVELGSDPAHQPLFPAILASHPDLHDVFLEWRNF
ncbi:hypothetical protein BH11PSE8_BH11PSE8_12710 [soil metagenome]